MNLEILNSQDFYFLCCLGCGVVRFFYYIFIAIAIAISSLVKLKVALSDHNVVFFSEC